MSRRAFRLAYDGAPFRGFQRQPDVPTVEDALFDVLRALGVLDDAAPRPSGYAASGRTDAGVSARAQTVAFDCPDWLEPSALNAELPDAVWAWASADVPSDFHARHDARYREYVYYLHAPEGDVSLAREAARGLSGERDFRNLTSDRTGTVRDLELALAADGEFLVLTARAGGFPRGLVRRVASLVGSVATGDVPPTRIERVCSADPLPGSLGVPAAPPGPLVLVDVGYEGVTFERDERAAEDARRHFARSLATHRALARVADAIEDL